MKIADQRYVSSSPYMVSTHWGINVIGATFASLRDAIRYFWVGDHHPGDDVTFDTRWLIDARGEAVIWYQPANTDPIYRLACTDEAICTMESEFPNADTSEIRMYAWQRQVVIEAGRA